MASSAGDDPNARVDLSLSRASGKDLTKFVMYSQGNFVSNQGDLEKNCSILLKLTLGVDGATGEPYFKKAEYIPIYTQKKNRQGASHHTVWPVEEALALVDTEENPFNSEDKQRLPKAWDHIPVSYTHLRLRRRAGPARRSKPWIRQWPLWSGTCGRSAWPPRRRPAESGSCCLLYTSVPDDAKYVVNIFKDK